MSKKTIAVLGATGAQGGGLVRAILADPEREFRARAVVRDPESNLARGLAASGAEIVRGDLDDPQSIREAAHGAYGLFGVTFFWAHFSPEKELEHARAIAQAAKDANVSHVVWSTLEDTRAWVPLSDPRMPTLMEKYKVPHFDAKGEGDHFFRDLAVPTTSLRTSFFWDNLIHFGMGPREGEDGTLVFALPMADKKLPGIAAEDIGKCALGIFKRGDAMIGRTVGIAGEHLTGAEMADRLQKVLGRPVAYVAVPFEQYRALDFPGAQDLGNMFQIKAEFEEAYCGNRDLALSRELNPALLRFEDWLAANRNRIPIG